MLTARLSIMMFLEFFIWGAYFVSMVIYLNAETAPLIQSEAMTVDEATSITANAYSAIPLGAVIAPLFLGLLADRLLPAQVVLGLLHLIGGGLLIALPSVPLTQFVPLLIAYAVCYMPTLGLTNTVAFKAISDAKGDAEKAFPVVRVFGTIGWIVAGLTISGFKLDADAEQFRIAGYASILLGLYSFTLPSTPPAMKGKPVSVGSLLGADALVMLKDRSFTVFLVASMLLCIPLAFYYQQIGAYITAAAPVVAEFPVDAEAAADPDNGEAYLEAYDKELADRTILKRATAIATLGQVSEIGFMLLIPFFFRRLGTKWMLLVGMIAWAVRYVLFGVAFEGGIGWMVLLGIALHGICYDFFFVTGQIYVDNAAPPEIRGQAQGLLVLLTQGIGMIVGAQLTGVFANWAGLQTATEDWQTFWAYPAVIAAIIAVAFALLFKEPPRAAASIEDESLAEAGVPVTEPSL